jgi:hypothetical protein
LGDHSLDEIEDFSVVNHFINILLHFRNLLTHSLDELFFIRNVWLNGIKQQMGSLFLLLSNPLNLLSEDVSIRWFVHFYPVLIAFIDQEVNLSLCIIAKFDPLRIRQTKWLFTFVQVNEMSNIFLSKRFNDFPSIIFGNRNTVQLHHLRSIASLVVKKKLT